MGLFADPELERQWVDFAEQHHKQKQKMLAKRLDLKRMLALTTARLNKAKQGKKALEIDFLNDQHRLLQLALKQMEIYNLDTDVYQSLEGVTYPDYQLRDLEIRLLKLRLEAVDFRLLDQLLEADLAAARAGEAAQATYKEPWLTLRGRVAQEAELGEKFNRFREANREFQAGLAEASEAFSMLTGVPHPKERLEQAKGINIPAVNGLAYRVNTALQQIPEGPGLLGSLRPAGISFRKGEKPSEHPATKTNLTDRLRGLFKPDQKR